MNFNIEKIQKIEDEVKEMHFKPTRFKHRVSTLPVEEIFADFWNYHVKNVIEESKRMAEKYSADIEAVWLAAIFHDIARIDDKEPHEEIGSEQAKVFLLEKGFEPELVEKIKGIILAHRCGKFVPETLEQKVVASADAIAHFKTPFYLWVGKIMNQSMEEMLAKNSKKIERDFYEKIFFDEEREAVRKQYEVLSEWCGSKSES
jgi:putative nucleotidyltransferase with HDIG domain